jgi:phosphoribosylformylglycinamidine cyclo-ligase
VPPVFDWIARGGDVAEGEMYRVFNMGAGMLVVVSAAEATRVPDQAEGLDVYRVGEIVAGDGEVTLF